MDKKNVLADRAQDLRIALTRRSEVPNRKGGVTMKKQKRLLGPSHPSSLMQEYHEAEPLKLSHAAIILVFAFIMAAAIVYNI